MKKYKIRLVLIFTFLLFIIGCSPKNPEVPEEPSPNPVEEEPSREEETPEVDEIQEILNKMTLEEKVGQLLLVGFEGTEANEKSKYYIEDLAVGGLIFFTRNIQSKEQVNSMVKDFNELSKIPLLLGIDEEGGLVSRLPGEYTKLPAAVKLGNKNDTNLGFEYGKLLGNRVKSLGLNLNFAPIMDIHSNPSNPVIGNRAFGTDPDLVSKIGLSVAEGIRSRNVIPSIKHFPGHGDTSTDSHIELPLIDKSLEELLDFELIPFKKSIDEEIEMIMSAHILIPSIDSQYPATLSKRILGDLLRDELGYQGVIISDDMTMGAIINNYSLEEASIDFLKAGGDILLVCHGAENPDLVFNQILESVEDGVLSVEEIESKVYRILELKSRYLNMEDNKIDIEDLSVEDLNLEAESIIKRLK